MDVVRLRGIGKAEISNLEEHSTTLISTCSDKLLMDPDFLLFDTYILGFSTLYVVQVIFEGKNTESNLFLLRLYTFLNLLIVKHGEILGPSVRYIGI